MSIYSDVGDEWIKKWKPYPVEYIPGVVRSIPLTGIDHMYEVTGDCDHCGKDIDGRRYQTIIWIPGHDKSVMEIGSHCIEHLLGKEYVRRINTRMRYEIIPMSKVEAFIDLHDAGIISLTGRLDSGGNDMSMECRISGNTYGNKEIIKDLGCRWDRSSKTWIAHKSKISMGTIGRALSVLGYNRRHDDRCEVHTRDGHVCKNDASYTINGRRLCHVHKRIESGSTRSSSRKRDSPFSSTNLADDDVDDIGDEF